jgi:NADPH-dependent 2,4-dienoyl-CoA reductase/sulfur reductase-like enzyme/nitrite reductase/ring-hydroxylating ferredoxin subunit
MSADEQAPAGPDLKQGISIGDLLDGGMLAGHVDGEAVLLARRGPEWFAIGATCTHYSGPLPEGLMVGDTVRCPWHHACFSLRTGHPVRPPALHPLSRWMVEERGGRVYVTGKATTPVPRAARSGRDLDGVVIVGGGAAGDSAVATLRMEGYEGTITVVDPDPDAPYDRPNCSKDYLAGTAQEEWMPLRAPEFDRDCRVERLRGQRVKELRPGARQVLLDDGRTLSYGALLLATGSTPIGLPAGVDRGGLPVYYLRSLADSRTIIAAAKPGRRAIVFGASFIGLEVAASLRSRELEVHVVAPDSRPLERVMGPQLGDFVRKLHEAHGVQFHLGQKAREISAAGVVLENGDRLDADFVVAGLGVRPNVELAETAGLTLDRGVVVNEFLETSAPGIFAAGDIARWPDPHTGDRIRVEHWVVAQRQGRTAARNILGRREPFDAVPFFWSQHYDVSINYVGHAERWDTVEVDGDIDGRDCAVRFTRGGRVLALATIFRDRESLETEASMEGVAGQHIS